VISHRPHGIEIYLGFDERDVRTGRLRPFAETGQARLGTPRTIVLMAGHGAGDPGVKLGGDQEADLALEVCRMAAERIRSDLGLEVVIARAPKPGEEPGVRPGYGEADALISVHFHARRGGPAAFVPRGRGEQGTSSPTLEEMGFVPAMGVQESDLTPSRLLARSVLDAVSSRLDQADLGVHTENLTEWTGATMPTMALELGEGEPGWPRDRLSRVAAGLAEGLRLYSRALEDRR
jgi:N-acetylmuramoyl-L-alanine amidase